MPPPSGARCAGHSICPAGSETAPHIGRQESQTQAPLLCLLAKSTGPAPCKQCTQQCTQHRTAAGPSPRALRPTVLRLPGTLQTRDGRIILPRVLAALEACGAGCCPSGGGSTGEGGAGRSDSDSVGQSSSCSSTNHPGGRPTSRASALLACSGPSCCLHSRRQRCAGAGQRPVACASAAEPVGPSSNGGGGGGSPPADGPAPVPYTYNDGLSNGRKATIEQIFSALEGQEAADPDRPLSPWQVRCGAASASGYARGFTGAHERAKPLDAAPSAACSPPASPRSSGGR